jgi:hypothetical protein
VIKLEGKAAGNWETIALLENNYQRLVHLPVGRQLEGVRFTLVQTWGADASKVFAFTVK